MNISRTDTVRAVLASLLVAALVPYRPVRVGALLSAAGVLAAALVHTPVGLNATRLVVMFALPVLAAAARPPRRADRAAAGRAAPGAVAGIGPGGVAGGRLLVAAAGGRRRPAQRRRPDQPSRPTSRRCAPSWPGERLTGRVEMPPTRNYWEAA